MTGHDIRAVRRKYGMSHATFASLIGSAQSTVYRWEASGNTQLAIDQGHRRIIAVMDAFHDAAVAADVDRFVQSHGGLHGLYILLRHVYGDEDE